MNASETKNTTAYVVKRRSTIGDYFVYWTGHNFRQGVEHAKRYRTRSVAQSVATRESFQLNPCVVSQVSE